jgi:hypothetical protein
LASNIIMVTLSDQSVNCTSSTLWAAAFNYLSAELSDNRDRGSNTSDVSIARLSATCSSQQDSLSDLMSLLLAERSKNHQLSQEIEELRKQQKEWDKIKEISLSPISMPVYFFNGTTLRVKPPKKITFKVKHEDGLYIIEKKAYSLLAFSITRDGLISELCEQVVFLWEEFVKDTSTPLTASAEKLRQKLIADFEEI